MPLVGSGRQDQARDAAGQDITPWRHGQPGRRGDGRGHEAVLCVKHILLLAFVSQGCDGAEEPVFQGNEGRVACKISQILRKLLKGKRQEQDEWFGKV